MGHLNGQRFGAFVRCRFERIRCVRRIKVNAVIHGIEFIIFSHPLEHRTRCKRDLTCSFVALFCRFTFVYAMMNGISIDVMLNFTHYIKS